MNIAVAIIILESQRLLSRLQRHLTGSPVRTSRTRASTDSLLSEVHAFFMEVVSSYQSRGEIQGGRVRISPSETPWIERRSYVGSIDLVINGGFSRDRHIATIDLNVDDGRLNLEIVRADPPIPAVPSGNTNRQRESHSQLQRAVRGGLFVIGQYLGLQIYESRNQTWPSVIFDNFEEPKFTFNSELSAAWQADDQDSPTKLAARFAMQYLMDQALRNNQILSSNQRLELPGGEDWRAGLATLTENLPRPFSTNNWRDKLALPNRWYQLDPRVRVNLFEVSTRGRRYNSNQILSIATALLLNQTEKAILDRAFQAGHQDRVERLAQEFNRMRESNQTPYGRPVFAGVDLAATEQRLAALAANTNQNPTIEPSITLSIGNPGTMVVWLTKADGIQIQARFSIEDYCEIVDDAGGLNDDHNDIQRTRHLIEIFTQYFEENPNCSSIQSRTTRTNSTSTANFTIQSTNANPNQINGLNPTQIIMDEWPFEDKPGQLNGRFDPFPKKRKLILKDNL